MQQVILAAFADNFVRKAPIFDKNGIEIVGGTAYQKRRLYEPALGDDETLNIHPLSGLTKELPEFAIYVDLF